MSMIKWLQAAVVAMFVLMVAAGLIVLAVAPERMAAFGQFIGILFPVFLAQVVPAMLGSPLTDYIRARSAQGGAGKPSATSAQGEALSSATATPPD